MLRRGQIFAGRYRIVERIGRGGTGIVYEAEHVATEERVALKVLLTQVLESRDTRENFQLEARIAARLGSEHIVRILDAGLEAALGLPYLVMELLRGQTLETLVTARGPLAPNELLWVMRQVAEALDRAHGHVDRKGVAAPIVHRDLKPDNLFLARRPGGGAIVKVLDFGVAKVLSRTQKLSQELRGTPLFMASEQIEGGHMTPQVDVWALGLIAFFLLTRRHYWLAANEPEAGMTPLFNEVLRLPMATPTERALVLGAEVVWPRAFDAWFPRCVNRSSSARFVSAGEAIEALGEALGSPASRSLGGSWLPPVGAGLAEPTPPGLGSALDLGARPSQPSLPDDSAEDGAGGSRVPSLLLPVDGNENVAVRSLRPTFARASYERHRPLALGLIATGALGVVAASFALGARSSSVHPPGESRIVAPLQAEPESGGHTAAPTHADALPPSRTAPARIDAEPGAPFHGEPEPTAHSDSAARTADAGAGEGKPGAPASTAGATATATATAAATVTATATATATATTAATPTTTPSPSPRGTATSSAREAGERRPKVSLDAETQSVESAPSGQAQPKPRSSSQPDPYEGR